MEQSELVEHVIAFDKAVRAFVACSRAIELLRPHVNGVYEALAPIYAATIAHVEEERQAICSLQRSEN